MANSSKIVIGIADMKMTNQGNELITYALGSCCGICLLDLNAACGHDTYNAAAEHGGGAHQHHEVCRHGHPRNPQADGGKGRKKAADNRKVAGGAKMFSVSGSGALGNIGQRNIESVHKVLRAEGIRLIAEDVGVRWRARCPSIPQQVRPL